LRYDGGGQLWGREAFVKRTVEALKGAKHRSAERDRDRTRVRPEKRGSHREFGGIPEIMEYYTWERRHLKKQRKSSRKPHTSGRMLKP